MSALVEIISQLVEGVSWAKWQRQSYFPFRHNSERVARLFDACLFKQEASGAVGILWIEFEGISSYLVMPFRLARYSEDGDLITLSPWSLREASSDEGLYEAWQEQVSQRGAILTARGAYLRSRTFRGTPGVHAIRMSSDTRSIFVRVESEETLKVFRTMFGDDAETLEVEILRYLNEQTTFLFFPKLLAIFEYVSDEVPRAIIAVSTKHIWNNGSLWREFTARIQHARFPDRGKVALARDSWERVLHFSESLGRLLAEYHRAMMLARENPRLTPEPCSGDLKSLWLSEMERELRARMTVIIENRADFEEFALVVSSLPTFVERFVERVRTIENLGLRIRVHGRIHLGEIVVSRENLFLLDFADDPMDTSAFRALKQPCLKDVVSLILSVKYAWYLTESRSWSLTINEFVDKESEFGLHLQQQKTECDEPRGYHPALQEIESTFLRFYLNAVAEDPNATELVPREFESFQALYNLLFLMRVMKEIVRDFRAGNPRVKMSLNILREFLLTRTNEGGT